MASRPLGALRKGAATHRVLHALRTALRGPATLPPGGGGVLVAVSGGQDSLALALALHGLQARGELPTPLTLAHCNHGWPGDCIAAAHVVHFAAARGLPVLLARGRDVAQTEAGARAWRYGALRALADAAGARAVLAAHTRTDLAETALLNLAAGAGARGAGAMRWARALAPRVTLLRPLLDVPRADTARVCAEQGVAVAVDPYNAALRFKRNRVRRSAMPALAAAANPQAEAALARAAHLLRDDADALDAIAAAAFADAVQMRPPCVRVRRAPLRALHAAVRRRVLRRAAAIAARPAAHPCSFAHAAALDALLDAPPGARAPSLQGGARAEVDRADCIVISGGVLPQALARAAAAAEAEAVEAVPGDPVAEAADSVSARHTG